MKNYKRKTNYKCDYCKKDIYITPRNLKRDKTHTCSRKCKTKLAIKCPSLSFIQFLHHSVDLPLNTICIFLGISRTTLSDYMDKNNIPRRSLSEDNQRRYKYMTDDEIKNQTKKAINKHKELVRDGKYITKVRTHGLSKKKWWLQEYGKQYRADNRAKYNACEAKYRASKKNQTPELTQLEKKKIELYYEISRYLGPDWHVDHIKPISRGGLHHPDNLQVIPATENLKKHNNEDYHIPKHLCVRI